MRKSKKWKIFIISHERILHEMYCNDRDFSSDHYAVINVGQEPIYSAEKLQVYQQKDWATYKSLGKYWTESEGIYNLWRSGAWKNLEYIGFLHYDLELCLRDKKSKFHRYNITDRIEKYISKRVRGHISFETHGTLEDYQQKIMADERYPDQLSGEGRNCYELIIEDYNCFFQTNYTIKDFLEKKQINLCSCFLIDVYHFDEMMKWWESIVESGELLKYDPSHRYRLQGGLAERYFGVYMAFQYDDLLDLSLIHHYNDWVKQRRKPVCIVSRSDEEMIGTASFFNTSLGQIWYWKNQGYRVAIHSPQHIEWSEWFDWKDESVNKDGDYSETIHETEPGSFRPDDSMEILTNDELVRFWHQLYLRYCPISKSIELEAEQRMRALFTETDRVLGVLCRGTDYIHLKPIEHPRQPLPEELFPIIDEKLEYKGYSDIFLMSEDGEVVQKFKDYYGTKVKHISQQYVAIQSNEHLNEAYVRERIDIVQRNKEYLIGLVMLAKCKGLVAGRTSGSVMARIISNGYQDYYFWNRGRYGDELERQGLGTANE